MLLTLACLTGAQGQRFEWAKGYASAQQGSEIKGTVADREGNLYILGTFRNDARWDGEPLLPITPYGYYPDTRNTVIAKISPSGQMLWKKVIHGNNGQNSIPYDIKPVGDTAFACLVDMVLPGYDNYLYFLDTLIPGESDYPIASRFFCNLCLVYLLFDYSGNVLEQHFIGMSYLDAEGNDIVIQYVDSTPWYYFTPIQNPSFDVDARGNIYLSRTATDITYDFFADPWEELSALNGGISAIRVWIDRREVGVVRLDSVRGMHHTGPHLLKFSPHFDSLLTSRYLFQSGDLKLPQLHLMLDSDDVYAVGNMDMLGIEEIVLWIDSLSNIGIAHSEKHCSVGFIAKLDTELTPLWCKHLDDNAHEDSNINDYRSFFCNMSVDQDSNRVYVNGFVQRQRGDDFLYMIDGYPLEIVKNDAFVISFDMETGRFLSCGIVPSVASSHLGGYNANNNLVARNNRVLMQNVYYEGANYPNDTIRLASHVPSLGMTVFDYSGNVIYGFDFQSYSPNNRPSAISLVDSNFYLCNLLLGDAVFGEVNVPQQGYHACIARYVDTSFMSVYVPTREIDTVGMVTPVDKNAGYVFYPNPATDALHVSADGGSIGSVAAISVLGIRHPLPFVGNVVDVSSLPPGVYIMEIIINNTKSNLKFIKL